MKNNTLKDQSLRKKKYIIIFGLLIFVVVIINSFMNTYNAEKSKWVQRKKLEESKNINIKDHSILDLDQTTAMTNKMENIEKNLYAAIEKSKKVNQDLAKDINQKQKTIVELQKNILSLRRIQENDKKNVDDKISNALSKLNDKMKKQSKELENLRKDSLNNNKLNKVNIELPPLTGALADALEDKDKKNTSDSKSKEFKPNEAESFKPINIKVEKRDFFEFGSLANVSKDTDKKDTDKKDTDKTKDMDLMLGLVDATLVMGVDAPTNIGTKNSDAKDPLPVLLSVSSESLIANNYKQDYKDCLLLATATGNATTERAYMRLSKISCVSKNGDKRIEAAIQGWVIGEDNKAGLTGNLVTKSGSLILKGLMAGIAQGISNAASNSDTFVSNNSSGIGGNNLGDNLTDGFSNGAGSAFKAIADFYIQMAKDLYPVIEVRGGRSVQILIKGGEKLHEVEYNKVFVNSEYQYDLSANHISIDY
jgi:conjugal transfer pilus assembly protein TraB